MEITRTRVAKLYKDGLSQAEIGRRLHLSRGAVAGYVDRIRRRETDTPEGNVNPISTSELRRLVASGLTSYECALRLEVSLARIVSALDDLNLKTKPTRPGRTAKPVSVAKPPVAPVARRAVARRPAPIAMPKALAFALPAVVHGEITLLDAGPSHCRWPLWSKDNLGSMQVCGSQASGVYCETHSRLAYQKRAA